MGNKWVISGVIAALVVAFLAWLFTESSKPLPGTKIADLGRKHVPLGEKVEYNSNPPTSGPHDEDWIRTGVYEEPKDDRNLVHSLEHGYVIMHYRCNIATSSAVIANEVKQSSQDESTQIATDSSSPRNDDKQQCNDRKNQLAKVYESKLKRKLIVVPRQNLDTNFALTAWTYLDKFNPSTGSGLSVSEIDRIEKFIDAHLNQGPEKTME